MSQYKGGCLCGAIRWEAAGEPVFGGHCQCTDCQKVTGTGHASLMLFPNAAVTVTGPLKFHEVKADSGNTLARGFCPECGSPIMGRSSGGRDMVAITAGSLDDRSLFKPQMVIFNASAAAWDHVDPALPTVPKAPG